LILQRGEENPLAAGKIERLLLFDVDGTLIKVYGAGRRALEEAYSAVFGRKDVAAYLDPVWFAGKTDLYIFRQVAIDAGIPSWEFERLYAQLESVYLDRLRVNVDLHPDRQMLPGVEPLLESLLVTPGIGLGLMTGNLEAGARIKLSPWALNRFFPSGGFGSDALDRAGIGAIARERAERRMNGSIPPQNVFVFGDTVQDIAAARACGFHALAVASGWTDVETLRAASPDHCFPDLSDKAAVFSALGL